MGTMEDIWELYYLIFPIFPYHLLKMSRFFSTNSTGKLKKTSQKKMVNPLCIVAKKPSWTNQVDSISLYISFHSSLKKQNKTVGLAEIEQSYITFCWISSSKYLQRIAMKPKCTIFAENNQLFLFVSVFF